MGRSLLFDPLLYEHDERKGPVSLTLLNVPLQIIGLCVLAKNRECHQFGNAVANFHINTR